MDVSTRKQTGNDVADRSRVQHSTVQYSKHAKGSLSCSELFGNTFYSGVLYGTDTVEYNTVLYMRGIPHMVLYSMYKILRIVCLSVD